MTQHNLILDNPLSTEDLIAKDVGARLPTGMMAKVITFLAISWSLFQLWIASPLPFIIGIGVFNDTETRAIHLAFALILAFLVFPARHSSATDRVPYSDIALGMIAAATSLYLFVMYNELAQRPGSLTQFDLVIACIGLPLLLEAARRVLGPALPLIALGCRDYSPIAVYNLLHLRIINGSPLKAYLESHLGYPPALFFCLCYLALYLSVQVLGIILFN